MTPEQKRRIKARILRRLRRTRRAAAARWFVAGALFGFGVTLLLMKGS